MKGANYRGPIKKHCSQSFIIQIQKILVLNQSRWQTLHVTNTILASLFVLNNTSKLTKVHGLIVSTCRSANECINAMIHLAFKSEHLVEVFIVHPFPVQSWGLRGHYGGVIACALCGVANCISVGVVLL